MLTITYVLFALQLLKFATASPSPPRSGVQSIALTRRQDINPADNSTSLLERTSQEVEYTLQKHYGGFAAYYQNTGTFHPLDPLDTVTNVTKRAVGFEGLTGVGGGYTGTVAIGNPGQPFGLVFDTASGAITVVSSSCTSTTCQAHALYDPSTSICSVPRTAPFVPKKPQTAQDSQYMDTVTLASPALTDFKQVLGTTNSYPASLSAYATPPDGVIGLACSAISPYNAPSVPQNLVTQGALDSPVFAMRLSAINPRVTFGGTDITAFTGPITNVPLVNSGFWQVRMDGITVQNAPQGSTIPPPVNTGVSGQVILDTGSPLIIGDPTKVSRFYEKIAGSQSIGNGQYTVPCNALPIVSLSFGGRAFPIDPTIFNQGPIATGSNQCLGGVVATTSNQAKPLYWTIGNVFLQNVYAVYQLGSSKCSGGQVGFATPV